MKKLIVLLAMVFALFASVIPAKAEFYTGGNYSFSPLDGSSSCGQIVNILWRYTGTQKWHIPLAFGLSIGNFHRSGYLTDKDDSYVTAEIQDVSCQFGYWSNRRRNSQIGGHISLALGFAKKSGEGKGYILPEDRNKGAVRMTAGLDIYLNKKRNLVLVLDFVPSPEAIFRSRNNINSEEYVLTNVAMLGVGIGYFFGENKVSKDSER